MTTKIKTAAPARTGRERTCTQCGAVYRSPRKSHYCSNACRMKAKRGRSPAPGARPGQPPEASFTIIGRLLVRLGFAGPIGPSNLYGLTVPASHALTELQLAFDRNGWGHLSESEFNAALSADGIRRYATDSPEAVERKRLQARQRVATARLAMAA